MPAIKLCIFGGASHYVHEMLYTFFRHVAGGDLAGSTITLHDIDRENLRLMAEFGRSVVKAKNLDVRLESAEKLEEALEGADFVLSTIRAGGFRQEQIDETVPFKHGFLGQETTGVSGIFMVARNAGPVRRLVQTMEKVCPEAMLINYTNPTGMVTALVNRISRIKTYGLCDGVIGVKEAVGCFLLGLPFPEAMRIEAYAYGVNHCTWSLGLAHQGRDLYPRIPELIEKTDLAVLGRKNYCAADACRLFRYYGLLPGSTYYTRYYYNLSKVIRLFTAPDFATGAANKIEHSRQVRNHMLSQLGRADADFLPPPGGYAAHGDQAVGTIHAIACDTRKMDIVNVVNNGLIANLPADSVVEVPAVMTRQGPRPIAGGPLPESVAGIVQMVDLHSRLAVSAALTGDRKLVMQAALAHPCNRDFDAMEACLEELFEAHRDWLPQFQRT